MPSLQAVGTIVCVCVCVCVCACVRVRVHVCVLLMSMAYFLTLFWHLDTSWCVSALTATMGR